MPFSVLIPWRPQDPWRERLRDWVERRWRACFPNAEICYGAGPLTGPFCRAAAINEAFRASTRDILVVADADTVFEYDALMEALRLVKQHQGWALPYRVYYNLREEETLVLLERDPISSWAPHKWIHRLTGAVSGVLVLPRQAFLRVGGFDERFKDWGGEDRAFAASLDRLWGQHYRCASFCLHLWHEESPRYENPHWPANYRLEQAYLAAKNKEEMERVRFGKLTQ